VTILSWQSAPACMSYSWPAAMVSRALPRASPVSVSPRQIARTSSSQVTGSSHSLRIVAVQTPPSQTASAFAQSLPVSTASGGGGPSGVSISGAGGGGAGASGGGGLQAARQAAARMVVLKRVIAHLLHRTRRRRQQKRLTSPTP